RRRRTTPATADPAAVPDQERIGRQAPCSVDDHCVGSEGEGEVTEAACTEGARHEQSDGEVAEAGDALIRHAPTKAAYGRYEPVRTGFCRSSWCICGKSTHVDTPKEERPYGPGISSGRPDSSSGCSTAKR